MASSPAAAERWLRFVGGLFAWLEIIPGLVINRPGHATDNALKPGHEELLAAQGFHVPASITSSQRDKLLAFAAEGATVVKSVSGVRSDAREVTRAELNAYSSARGPLHLQRRVRGVDVRAHVVHETVHQEAIHSAALDYRQGSSENRYAPAVLPDALSAALVAETHALGLEVAGWDFKVDREGRFWCLEGNPMPGFSSYDRHLNLAISRAVVERLNARRRGAPNLGQTWRQEHRPRPRHGSAGKRGAARAVVLAPLACLPAASAEPMVHKGAQALDALGLLTHLAYETASENERRALEGIGSYLGPDARTDARFPQRPALREAVEPRCLELAHRARRFFLQARLNPVVLHAAALEAGLGGEHPGAQTSRFLSRHAPQAAAQLTALMALIGEMEALPAPPALARVSLGAQVRQVAESDLAGVRRHVADATFRRTPPAAQATAFVLVSPFLPSLTRFNAQPRGSGRWLVVGPSPSAREDVMLLAHEILHHPVHDLMNTPALLWATWRSRRAFASIRRSERGTQGYEDWRSYLEEGIVRALSYEVAGVPCRDTGFFLEQLCGRDLPRGQRERSNLMAGISRLLKEVSSTDALVRPSSS